MQDQVSSFALADTEGLPKDTSREGPWLIVGLGNPGSKYRNTRHNYGFLVIDELVRRWKLVQDDICSSEHYLARREGDRSEGVHLAKPQIFMNRSGLSVRCLAQRFEFDPGNVLVVYDDISLPFAKQRLRAGGSAGGHRGLESVIENLRTVAVPRLRLGIAGESPKQALDVGEANLSDFVLEDFSVDQTNQVSACVRWAADACEAWLRYGIDRTMNQFNGTLPLGDD